MLTDEQVQVVIGVLSAAVIDLKGRAGTEFRQAQLSDVIERLSAYRSDVRYCDFDAWFWEVENYSTRGDRFYDELPHADEKRIFEWLKAAWDCAREKNDESTN